MTRLDDQYFQWLIDQVAVPRNKTCYSLLGRMHEFEFVWSVPNDDNRVQDGKDLRYEFFGTSATTHGSLHPDKVSFLEVLIGLSRRVAFTAGGDARQWAWKLIKNLNLHKMCDPILDGKASKVDDILNAVVWRRYSPDGTGGFFPVREAFVDMTQMELWFQMNAYVNETVGA